MYNMGKAKSKKPKAVNGKGTSDVKKKDKPKLGRPATKFTKEQITQMEDYALAGCQNNTIATLMDIPMNTLLDHFRKLLTKKRCERKYNLRKAQNDIATGDSKAAVTMLIFLGKNELGQADKMETQHGITDDLKDLLKEICSGGSGLEIKNPA